MTTNLGVTQVTAAQNDKETTINNGFAAIDAAITDELTVPVDNSNAETITEAQLQQHVSFLLSDNGADAAVTITVDGTNARGLFIVKNRCTQTATVEISGQTETSPTVSDGDDILLYSDGSDVVQVSTGAVDTTARAKTNLLWNNGSGVASASTLDLSGLDGDEVEVSGTTTITAVTIAAGQEVTLKATGAWTLEHDGGDVTVPGADDIVCDSGSRVRIRATAANTVEVLWAYSSDGDNLFVFETGTFTPTYDFDTTGDLSVTYGGLENGIYIDLTSKTVNLQWFALASTWSHSTASGNLRLDGLPNANNAGTQGISLAAIGATFTFTGNENQLLPLVRGGGRDYAEIRAVDFGTSQTFFDTSYATTSDNPNVVFNGSYQHAV